MLDRALFTPLKKNISANVSLLYPLKRSEKQMFSDVFREYRSGTLFENGLTKEWPKIIANLC